MIPLWATNLPWPEIQAAAATHRVSPLLVAAVVQQESHGEGRAPRYERGFRWVVKPAEFARDLGMSVETETILQMMSWGPMQIMGGTARDRGFKGFIVDLVQPSVGIHWGTLHLSLLLKQYVDTAKTLAAYNAGSPRLAPEGGGKYENQAYVDKVMGYLAELKAGTH